MVSSSAACQLLSCACHDDVMGGESNLRACSGVAGECNGERVGEMNGDELENMMMGHRDRSSVDY
jgi:hypothetical protein